MCVYVLVALAKKQLKLDRRLGEILQILSVTLFENTPLLQAFLHECTTADTTANRNPLSLFDSNRTAVGIFRRYSPTALRANDVPAQPLSYGWVARPHAVGWPCVTSDDARPRNGAWPCHPLGRGSHHPCIEASLASERSPGLLEMGGWTASLSQNVESGAGPASRG